MNDIPSYDPHFPPINDTDNSPKAPSFQVAIGDDDQVLLLVHSSDGEQQLSLTGLQAARLGRALLTASVALHAGDFRPPVGAPLDDCQFPVRRWIAARSGRNGMPIITTVLPGGIGLTLQLDEASLGKCGASLVELSQERSSWQSPDSAPTNGGALPM